MLRLTPCERERCFYWCLAKHSSCDAPAGVSIVGQYIEKFCGGFQRGTGVPLCVVAGGGFLRGRGSRNTLPLKRAFGYFSHERKVTRGPGAEPPQRLRAESQRLGGEMFLPRPAARESEPIGAMRRHRRIKNGVRGRSPRNETWSFQLRNNLNIPRPSAPSPP